MAVDFDTNLAGSYTVNPLAPGAVEGETRTSTPYTLASSTDTRYLLEIPGKKYLQPFVAAGWDMGGTGTTQADLQFARDTELATLQAEIDVMDSEDQGGIAAKKEEYDKLAASPLPDGLVWVNAGYVSVGGAFLDDSVGIEFFRATFSSDVNKPLFGMGIAQELGKSKIKGQLRFEMNDEKFNWVVAYKGPLPGGLYASGDVKATFASPTAEESIYQPGIDGFFGGMFSGTGVDGNIVPFDLSASARVFIGAGPVTLVPGFSVAGGGFRDVNNSWFKSSASFMVYNVDFREDRARQRIVNGVYSKPASGNGIFDLRNAGLVFNWGDSTITGVHNPNLQDEWTHQVTEANNWGLLAAAEFGAPTLYPLPQVFRPNGGAPTFLSASTNPFSIVLNLGVTQANSRGNGIYDDGNEEAPWETPGKLAISGSMMLKVDLGVGTDSDARYMPERTSMGNCTDGIDNDHDGNIDAADAKGCPP